jgi:hypothetical protein
MYSAALVYAKLFMAHPLTIQPLVGCREHTHGYV